MKAISTKYQRILSISLAVVLLFTSAFTGAYVYAESNKNNTDEAQNTQTDTTKLTKDDLESYLDNSELDQEETVYVIANTDGSSKRIIVSNWLKNRDNSSTLTDNSDLENVTNVKGDEKYTINKDNMRVWESNGKDIYYQGTTQKQLPVDIKISYKLDGKTISPTELAGKSGKVTITFEYTNNEKHTVTVNGKQEEMYTPFLMATGTILDNDKFTNISVSNGKLLNDGDKTIVMGIALPGMQKNLGIDKKDFDVPETVEITADVKDFSLTTTMSVAMNDVFSKLNLDKVDSENKLKNALNSLETATNQLLDGSSQLYNGLSELLSKTGTLTTGINDLYLGSKDLKAGTSDLKAGILTQLQPGVNELNEKVPELVSGTSDLKNGIDKQLVPGVNDLKANLPALKKGSSDLKTGLTTLVGNNDKLNGGAEKTFNALLASTDAQIAPVFAALSQTPVKLTIENYSTVLTNLITTTAAVPQLSDANTKLTAAKAQLDEYNTFYTGLLTYTTGVSNAQKGSVELDRGVDKLIAGGNQLEAGVTKLQAGAAKLFDGSVQLKAGVVRLKTGSDSLVSGATKLDNGATKLLAGTTKLNDGATQLVDGISQLKTGSMKLQNGLQEFKSTGIDKLVSLYNDDIEPLTQRLKAVSDLSKEYQSFSGIQDGKKGSVKFVYRTEEIK